MILRAVCDILFPYYPKEEKALTELENAREFEVQQFENGKTCVMKERRHTVSACIDVNDRYIANKSPEYVSDKNVFNEILEITSNIINNKLKDLVEKGEFSYDD